MLKKRISNNFVWKR